MADEDKSLILDTNLQDYFYQRLIDFNEKSFLPLPSHVIYYCSEVLNRYACSSEFFDEKDGKIREKIMGLKLIESQQLPLEQKIREYRDIGDYTLLLCGYFFDKFQRNRSLVSKSYYQKIGQTAYRCLNGFQKEYMQFADFYKSLAEYFGVISTLFAKLACENRNNEINHHYLEHLSEIAEDIDYDSDLRIILPHSVSSSKKIS